MLRSFAHRLSRFPALKRVLKFSYQTVAFILNYHRTKLRCRFALKRISQHDGGFFGYYDKSPESPDGRYVLYQSIPANEKLESTVMLYDAELDIHTEISKTRAVNFQIGSRLQWIDNDSFIFNSYDHNTDEFVSLIYNLFTKSFESNGPAVYDVNGELFAVIDFKHLNHVGSEYGYTSHQNYNMQPPDVVIVKRSLPESRLFITSDDVRKLFPSAFEDGINHHFNHLMFSPSGASLIALFRYTSSSGRKEILLHYSLISGDLKILNTEMTSHCCWDGNDHLVGYMSHLGKDGFYRLDIRDNSFVKLFPDVQLGDGHPSIKNGVLLFDSYPDNSRMQHIYLSGKSDVLLLGSFYSPLIYNESNRCDLHPRFNHKGNRIYFDSMHEGKRQLFLIDMSGHD